MFARAQVSSLGSIFLLNYETTKPEQEPVSTGELFVCGGCYLGSVEVPFKAFNLSSFRFVPSSW